MFKLEPAPTFSAAVGLTVPGQAAPGSITFTFRHQPRAALQAWLARPTNEPGLLDSAYLGAVIAGWSGPVDPDGQAVAYSAQALEDLVQNYPAAGREIFDAYLRELTESRRGN